MALFGSKKGLVGVDIGSSAVKAVELKPGGRGGEFHLVKLGLEPLPPEGSKDPNTRYVHIEEDKPVDEKQLADWIRQAAAIPGWMIG